ncbi:MAG: LmeA family phospholipid-binding protein [Actinomadura sp.]
MRKVLVVIAILLIGGIIVADRLGVRIAEDEIAKQVSAQYQLETEPDVTIHGVPFLTQALGGEYGQIDVALGAMTQRGVTVQDVTLEMRGVRAPLSDVINGNTSTITARTVTASAVVPYAALQKYAPQGVTRLTPRGSDLQARVAGSVFGLRMSGSIVASLKATSRGITVTPESISNSSGPQVPISVLRQRFAFTVPVQNLLPMGARVSELEVTPAGLRIGASVDDVELENLSKS